jgi:hypothetical protein
MKIRNGFVSNSSSSSFVILGVKTDSFTEVSKNKKQKYLKSIGRKIDDPEDLDDEFEEALLNGVGGLMCQPLDTGDYVIGRRIVDIDDNGLVEEVSIAQVNKISIDVKKSIQEMFDIDAEIKLFAGKHYC